MKKMNLNIKDEKLLSSYSHGRFFLALILLWYEIGSALLLLFTHIEHSQNWSPIYKDTTTFLLEYEHRARIQSHQTKTFAFTSYQKSTASSGVPKGQMRIRILLKMILEIFYRNIITFLRRALPRICWSLKGVVVKFCGPTPQDPSLLES